MNLNDILKIHNADIICGDTNIEIEHIKIDSRKVEKNDTFIGIKGDNYDGNSFYLDAIKNGANLIIIDNDKYIKKLDKTIVLVDDSVSFLQSLATYKMKKIKAPVIAVTGSVGKTTTKDIIYSVLKEKYKVLKTYKNYNGQIGLPLTVLEYKDEDIILLEMGMNQIGGIAKLSKIVKPDIAIITNIGTSHIGYLKSRENILKAKLEILEYMKKGSTVILNNDDDMLNKIKLKDYNVITYGINNKSDYNAYDIKLDYDKVTYKVNSDTYNLNMPGLSTIYNSLVSIIIGELFKIKNIKKILENVEITSNRLELKKIGNITIIDDCYNASYESMMNALDILKNVEKKRKIAILGDIVEIGDYAKEIHEKLGGKIENIDILITVGEYSIYIYNKANIKEKYHYLDVENAYKKIKEIIKEDDIILIKASNAMNFKYIVDKMLVDIN